MMEAVNISETSVSFYQATRRNILEDSVPVYPGFKTRWNYLETRRCVRDSDNGNFSGEGLVSHSELSDTRAKWTWPNR
jgi:hypothetical protein